MWLKRVDIEHDFRDDRGKELSLVEPHLRRAGLWHDRKRPWTMGASWMHAVVILVVCWVLYDIAVGRFALTPQNLWMLGIAMVYGIGFRIYYERDRRSEHSIFKRAAWAPVAWLCAHRHCGACGYGLAEVKPESAGIATCPECGAGWHRDRWTMADRDPRADKLLVAMLDGNQTPSNTFGGATDDRGVPIGAQKGWYPRWIDEDWVDVRTREAIRDRLFAIGARRMTIASVMLGVVWMVVVAALMRRQNPLPRDWWMDLALMATPTGLIALLLAYVAARMSVRSREVCQAAVALGRCANCGEKIEGAAGFDGCTPCGRCARAWRMPPTLAGGVLPG